MKKNYFLLLTVIGLVSNIYSQDYNWTIHSGNPPGNSSYSMDASDMAVSNLGNILITGNFRNTVDFDFGSGAYTLSADGNYYDVYVSKYDTDGNFIWARSVGSTLYESSTSIVVDENENVYISGSFEGSVDFDPDPNTEFILSTPVDKSKSYVLKLDVDGNFVWAKSFGNHTYGAQRAAITLDINSNIICVGGFRETADFDPSETEAYNLSSNGNEDVYILKLNSDGEFIWAKSLTGGFTNDKGTAVVVDYAGDIIIAGEFGDTVDFNPSTATTNNHTSAGTLDYFLLKLDSDGNYIWSKTAGGVKVETIYHIAIDTNNKIYIAGYLEEDADVDPSNSVFLLQVEGWFNAFMAKFESNGDFVWASNVDGPGMATSITTSITLDQGNNVYFSGYFSETVDMDITASTDNRTAIGEDDYFMIKLNENLEYEWAQTNGFSEGVAYILDTEVNNSGELLTFQKIDVYQTNNPDFDFTAGTDIQAINSYANVAISKWSKETCALIPVATVNDPVVGIGVTSAELTLQVSARNPISYTIDYDSMAEAEGFEDVLTEVTLTGATYIIPSTANKGTYNGTITYIDANGCSGTDDFTISVLEPIEGVNNSILSEISCFGNNDASIEVSVIGGTMPYVYELLDNSLNILAPSQNSNVFSGLFAGDYIVRVQDTEGQIYDSPLTITEPPSLNAQAVATGIICKGSNNGAIEVEANGGRAPYQYQINGNGYETSNIFEGLSPGNYDIEVIDSNGCTVMISVAIDEPAMAFAISNIESIDVGCIGPQGGSININVTGGVGPYQFQIDDGLLQDSNVFEDLGPGQYSVKAFDSLGCEQSVMATINNSDLSFDSIITKSASCALIDDGSIEIMAMGGALPYEYSLNGKDFKSDNVFFNLGAGIYEVYVRDANGCESVETVSVELEPGPDFDSDGIGDICDEDIDGDGVSNAEDLCADTPLGSRVDITGCETFTLPSNNFLVQTVGESCIESSNGSITVTAVENLGYTASLLQSGNSIGSMPFTEATSFYNLTSGVYELCITVDGYPKYMQCYSLQITEPEPLSVISNVDANGKVVTLKFKGGERYTIDLNGATYITENLEIALPLKEMGNTLSVKTDLNCQGTYEESILLGQDMSIYPNPVENGEVTIVFKTVFDGDIRLSMHTVNGRKVLGGIYHTTNNEITLDVGNVVPGVYILKVSRGTAIETQKVIIK